MCPVYSVTDKLMWPSVLNVIKMGNPMVSHVCQNVFLPNMVLKNIFTVKNEEINFLVLQQ